MPAQITTANQTTLDLSVFVNGALITTVPARNGSTLTAGQLPPMQWEVEVRTGRGRVLASFSATAADLQWTVMGEGVGGTIPGVRLDLSCGYLRMWVGDHPLSGPPPGPGTPGDCEPWAPPMIESNGGAHGNGRDRHRFRLGSVA